MSVIKILLAVISVSTSLQVQASGEQSVVTQLLEKANAEPESASQKNTGSLPVDETIPSVPLQNHSREHTGLAFQSIGGEELSTDKAENEEEEETEHDKDHHNAENASLITHSFLQQRPKVVGFPKNAMMTATEAGNTSLPLESALDDLGTVHMGFLGSTMPSSPLATLQNHSVSEDHAAAHTGIVSAFEADHGSHETFQNHSEDLAIVPILETNNASAFSGPENHEAQATLFQNHSEVAVVGQVRFEDNGSATLYMGNAIAEAATLQNHSDDFVSAHSDFHSTSKTANTSILSTQHQLMDSTKDELSQEDDAFGHDGAHETDGADGADGAHGDEDQHIHVNVTARSPQQDVKDEASKKQARTAPKFNDRNGIRDTKVLENNYVEWDMPPQIRALDFLEHRPSAVEVAAHQSGLMYNVWLVSRAGFGVVVGIAVALMWLLQCSRLCTRTTASPMPREAFDQQVLADVYKDLKDLERSQSSKISMISWRLAAATTPITPEARQDERFLVDVYKAAERSKLPIRSSSTPIQTARERYDQRILDDVYKVAQARPRVHKSGLEETVAESSRLLRWAASKRSKKKDSHGDEAADHFESKTAAKRWYDH